VDHEEIIILSGHLSDIQKRVNVEQNYIIDCQNVLTNITYIILETNILLDFIGYDET